MNNKMLKNTFKTFAVYIIVLTTSISFNAQADTLKIGTISTEPIEEMRVFQPFADYLAQQLSTDGIENVDVVIATSVSDAVELLKNDEIDIFIDSSVTALIVSELTGSTFMMRRWKKARGKYRSVVFVNTDSGITSLKDLVNQTVVFEDPFSTSGYFLPALAILNHGLELSELSNPRSKPASGKVGYVMAFDNETQIAWVERDRVAAGAMSEADFSDYSKNSLKPLTIIHTTKYVPYHVLLHRDGLDPALIKRIDGILKSAHESENGRVILEGFERTSLFDEIPATLLSDLKSLQPFLKGLKLTSKSE